MDYVGTRTSLYGSAGLTVEPQDDGALHAVWNGKADAWVEVGADKLSDIAREANGAMMLAFTVRLNAKPDKPVTLGIGTADVPATGLVNALPVGSYTVVSVPLSCFAKQDLGHTPTVMRLQTSGTLDVSISDVRLTEARLGAACPAS